MDQKIIYGIIAVIICVVIYIIYIIYTSVSGSKPFSATDLIDITGKWNIMYGGNTGTAVIVFNIATKTGTVTTTGNNLPGVTKIIYIDGKGYSYHTNPPATFTDSTYTNLDGGNYSFTK